MAFRSAIDTPQSARLSGWAVDEQGLPCTIRIIVGDHPPFEIMSDLQRPDLIAHAISKGLGGFVVDITPFLATGINHVSMTLPDGSHVDGSPMLRTVREDGSLITYRGSIGDTAPEVLSGWAVSDDGEPCMLSIEVDGVEVAREESLAERPDLVTAGIGKGRGGFHIWIGQYLKSGENDVAVRFPNGAHLPQSPLVRVIEEAPPVEEPSAPAQAPVSSELPSSVAAVPVDAPPAEEPAPAAVPIAAKAQMPSLIELDELSLDDISYAVASGAVSLDPPEIPPLEPRLEREEAPVRSPQAQPSAVGGSWLGRLFGRRN